MDAQPTPFDIASVPAVPFTPSPLLWLMVLGLLLIPFLLLAFSGRNRSRRPLALRTLTAEQLKKLAATPPASAKQTASEAALVLRRFLAGHFGLAVEALSSEELNRLAAAETSELARTLTPLLIQLDLAKFAPEADPASIHSLIDQAHISISREEMK